MKLSNNPNDNRSSYSQFKHSTKQKIKQNIMIRQKFPINFKKQYWLQINLLKPLQFLHIQKQILHFLLNNQEFFNIHFREFYNNHSRLYQWHVLANQKHHEMREYIFTQLLKKSVVQYKVQLKDNLVKSDKTQYKNQNYNDLNLYCTRSLNQSPNSKNYLKTPNSPINSNQSSIHVDNHKNILTHKTYHQNNSNQQQEDYHALFVKTLDACDGSKYIHYDFGKHQRGYSKRNLYNKFIRGNNYKKNWLLKNQSFHQQLNRMSAEKQNHYEKDLKNLMSITSYKQKGFYKHPQALSRFELTTMSELFEDNRKNSDKAKLFGSSRTKNKTLVLKKMPHQFGKPKPYSAFVIKIQQPPSTLKS